MKLRFIGIILALTLILSLSACSGGSGGDNKQSGDSSSKPTSNNAPVSNNAPKTPVEYTDVSEFEYYLDPTLDGIVIAKFIGYSAVVNVPAEIDGSPVVSIDKEAFEYQQMKIKSVSIPDSVKIIGENAFKTQVDLAVVSIGNGVERIEDYAFRTCRSLKTVEIPDSVVFLGMDVFEGCRELTTISIGSGLKEIAPDYSHYPLGLCEALENIKVSGDNEYFSDKDGVLFSKDETILIRYPSRRSGAYIVPDGVLSIADSAFSNDARDVESDENFLTGITFPESLQSIGQSAFRRCTGLTSIAFPKGLVELGDVAFMECTGLTNVYLPDGLMKIGEQVFSDCDGLTSANIPDNIKIIPNGMFAGCENLIDITLPENLEKIEYEAFRYCQSLNDITLPASLNEIEKGAFAYCDSLNDDIRERISDINSNALRD